MKPILIYGNWRTRFLSLSNQVADASWDTISAEIIHRGKTVDEVRAMYPLYAAVGIGLGFYMTGLEVRPSSILPGCTVAAATLSGAFDGKLKTTGAASAHSESPSNIKIFPLSSTVVFQKTDILICEPTFEVMALDNVAPDTLNVGKTVTLGYGGTALPPAPANPFNFGNADISETVTVHYPYGWVYMGVEYERLGTLYLKRYYYAYRHLLSP